MKRTRVLLGLMVLLSCTCLMAANLPEPENQDEKLQVICSKDVFEDINACIEVYNLKHPELKVLTEVFNDQDLGAWIAEPGHLALVTKEAVSGLSGAGTASYVIARDVYVPVIHRDNPECSEILVQGISPAEFSQIFTEDRKMTWGDIAENGRNTFIEPCRVEETQILESFFASKTGKISGKEFENCERLLEEISMNRNAIGFCKLSLLQDLDSHEAMNNVHLVPIDLNDNNHIDHFEAIYGNLDDLVRGIWIGKYPMTLYKRIFAICTEGDCGKGVQGLISWFLTDGQEQLAEIGYTGLLENEQASLLAKVSNSTVSNAEINASVAPSRGWIIALGFIVFLGVLSVIVLAAFNKKEQLTELSKEQLNAITTEDEEVPGGYLFDRSHTWTYLERNGRIRIGLDAFLQKITGKITKIELKSPGQTIQKGETVFILVQNGKRLEIKSPVSGMIMETNQDLEENASLVNEAPYSDGWIYLIEPIQWVSEYQDFLRPKNYLEWIKSEYVRLKDFLARIPGTSSQKVILQDGGEVREGLLMEFGPEVWDDFQTIYLKN